MAHGHSRQIASRGWKKTILAIWRELNEDNVSLVSAGVSFYALLALFPVIGAGLSIYGLVADPQQITQYISSLTRVLPDDARSLVEGQITDLVKQPRTTLSFGAGFGMLLGLWSGSRGMKSLITALNIV